MRRGRILATAVAVLAAVLLTAAGALAASPREIYADLAAHGKLTKHYSAADLRRAAHDAALQGYGGVEKEIMKPLTQGNGGTEAASLGGTAPASGTLPFTGLQLGVFFGVGLLLLAGGLIMRRLGRGRS